MTQITSHKSRQLVEFVLSDSDPEDYVNYPKLSHMTPKEREKRIKQLWRSVVNFSLASAIFVN